MHLSYTEMSRTFKPQRLAGLGCNCMQPGMGDLAGAGPSPRELDAWLASLSPIVRTNFNRQMQAIMSDLPQAAGERVIPGLGFVIDAGLSQVISSVLTTASDIAIATDTNSTNQSISKAASKTESAIAAANAAMSGQASTSVSQMQIQANLEAAKAGNKTTLLLATIIGAVGLGGLALYLSSRKK